MHLFVTMSVHGEIYIPGMPLLINGPGQRHAYQKDILKIPHLLKKRFTSSSAIPNAEKDMLCEYLLDSRSEDIFKYNDAQRIRATPLLCILTSEGAATGHRLSRIESLSIAACGHIFKFPSPFLADYIDARGNAPSAAMYMAVLDFGHQNS